MLMEQILYNKCLMITKNAKNILIKSNLKKTFKK